MMNMTNEPNPYMPPSATGPADDEPPSEVPLDTYTVQERGGAPWKLSTYPTAIRLEPSDDQPKRSLNHHAFIENTGFTFFASSSGQLILRQPRPRVILTLTPEVLVALRAWLTPALDEHLAKMLARHRGRAVIVGLLFVAISFPWSEDPLGLAFGVGWFLWAAATTVKPRRELFLIDAGLWTCVWIRIVWHVIVGRVSLLFLFFLVSVVPLVMRRARAYRFYGPSRPS